MRTDDEQRRRSTDTDIAVLRSDFEAHRVLTEQHRLYEVEMLGQLTKAIEKLGAHHEETQEWRSNIDSSIRALKWLVIYAPPVLVSVAGAVWFFALQVLVE